MGCALLGGLLVQRCLDICPSRSSTAGSLALAGFPCGTTTETAANFNFIYLGLVGLRLSVDVLLCIVQSLVFRDFPLLQIQLSGLYHPV